MGVLFDYFRAPAGASVAGPRADAVAVKGIDPAVAVGQLVALAAGEPYVRDPAFGRVVWPAGETDLEYMGPWVRAIDDPARDVLAGIAADDLRGLAERWSAIDEFGNFVSAEELRGVLADLVALAGRARDAGESLYCRVSI